MNRFKRRLASVALGLSVAAGAASASAGEVKGSVKSSEEPRLAPIAAVRAPYFFEWNGFIEPKKAGLDLAREVAVVLIGATPVKDAPTVLLKNGTLTPSTIVVQAGTSLRVRNDDDFTHKLHAEGLASFDAIETSSGSARQVDAGTTGTFVISDDLAAHVKGTLHVLPKVSAVASPSNDGSFVFADVPAGTYTLKVFRGAFEVSSSEIEVKESGELEIDPIAVDLKAGK